MISRSTMLCVATLLAAWPGGASARDAHCKPIGARSVQHFFEQWDEALASGDPRKVADRYAPDAVLLPTLSDVPRTERTGIEDYFRDFLRKHPRGTIDSRTIRIGCNEAFDVGTYTFMVDGPGAGERVPVKARFSFVYEVRGGRWVITHHHSSLQPPHVESHAGSGAGLAAGSGVTPVATMISMPPAADRCSLPLAAADLE